MIFQMQTTIKADDVAKQIGEMLGVDLMNCRNATIHLSISPDLTQGMRALQMHGGSRSGFTRMDQNLRPTQTK